jgi:hypothetical protein
MATLSEHVKNIQAAFEAVRDDGFTVELDYEFSDWEGGLKEVRLDVVEYHTVDVDGVPSKRVKDWESPIYDVFE